MASEAESQREIVDVVTEDGEMEDSDLDTMDMLLRRVGDLTEEVEQCKIEIQRLRDTSYDGRNIWRFDGVLRRLKNPEVEPTTGHSRHYYYGPPYYTSKYGYKVGLAVNISRAYGSFSVYFLMYRGEYDSLLPWPVRFTVKLTVAAPRKSKQASILSTVSVFKLIPNTVDIPETFQFPMLLTTDQMIQFEIDDCIFFKSAAIVYQETDRFLD